MEKRVSAKALLPFGVFVGVYLITGIVLNSQGVEMAFYQLPAPIAALIGVLSAFVLFKGKVDDKLAVFLKGCGHVANSARTAHPFQRNGAPFRFKLSKAQQVN